MKKIFTLVAAAFMAFAMNAQVKSTVMELRPTTFVEETADQSWVFQNGISVKVNGKSYASVDAYTDGTETAPYALLKVSKDKAGTITIPSNLGVVKVAFYGVSNSSALNWAYLQSFANTLEFPIMTAEARDVMKNEEIQKLQYPISPMVSSLAQPFATFTAEKGTAWFEELNFEFDGNNQVAINIVLWTVGENEVEAWDPATDENINAVLSSEGVLSKIAELRPTTFVEMGEGQAWTFNNGITMKVDGKDYAEGAGYKSSETDSVPYSLMKISKDKNATIFIPSNLGVVKVAFYGVSNSGEAHNWAYLQSFANTPEFPIMTPEERDVLDNEAIQRLQYPISPIASTIAKPFAEFVSEKGTAWFEELNFLFDGHNQVWANIVLWVVDESEVEAWDPESDKTITNIEEVVIPVSEVIYNLQGQIVGEDYKGIIIKGGKKYLNK